KEKLQLPVEFFNPIQNVMASESAPVQEVTRSASLLGELIGLALQSVTTCPMELHLYPASVVRRKELERRRPFLIAAAACFLLVLLGWSAYYTRATQVTRQSSQILQRKIDTMRSAETRLDTLKKQATSPDRAGTPLVNGIKHRH